LNDKRWDVSNHDSPRMWKEVVVTNFKLFQWMSGWTEEKPGNLRIFSAAAGD
jgi:hypothetical protein